MAEVSVLLPVHNGEPFLTPAIDSILQQTFTDFELLIVDDGSTDGTADRVRSYSDPRIRLVSQDRSGLSAALNRGLHEARAALVARQDADDISHPERLRRQVDYMRRSPNTVLLGTLARQIDESGRVTGAVQRPVDRLSVEWYANFDNPFIHSTVIFRRNAALRCGGYDATWDPFSQDYALWFQMMRHGEAVNLDERLLDYRVRSGSIIGQIAHSHSADYRERFASIVRELVRRHQLASFGGNGLTPADAELMAGVVLGVRASELPQLLETFSREMAWFSARHPGVLSSAAFRQTLAGQYDALAYHVRPPSRAATVRVYAAALRASPGLAFAFSWPRFLALAVFGKRGRLHAARWWRDWRTA